MPPVKDDLQRWRERWSEAAARLRDDGRFRTPGQGGDAPFCHNDYLGLRRDPRLLDGLRRALDDGLPSTSTGSRLLSGNLERFGRFEADFARAAGAEAGLLFGSASEANRVAIATLAGRRDEVLHDELAHASLIDGAVLSGARRRRFRHNDPSDLRRRLAESPPGGIRLVVTESVFSMDGDTAPLADLHQVCREAGAMLLVDEAHAAGLFGASRTGLCESLPRDGTLAATTHGFGKGLASAGGILCTTPPVVEAVYNTARAFLFTTAPSPLAVEAARLAWEISRVDTARQAHLRDLWAQMDRGVADLGWVSPGRGETPIFPLLCGGLERAARLSERLHERGIPLRPIRPPTVPAGTERLRATVTADLELRQVHDFLEILRAL